MKISQYDVILFNRYYTRMEFIFQEFIFLSKADQRVIESEDIFGHLKRLIDFTSESKKLRNVLAITSVLE